MNSGSRAPRRREQLPAGRRPFVLWAALGVAAVLLAVAGSEAQTGDLKSWIKKGTPIATRLLLANISPAGASPGSVIASPSRQKPDYYYHWVRDGALVMLVVNDLRASATSESSRKAYTKMLWDFAEFSRRNQLTPTRSGHLGEPKFHVDGSAFNADWGRPQNDGPALRAVALTRFAHSLLKSGREGEVRARLYDAPLPAKTVIKADLEFVSHHWQERSFDLWEEVQGHHFYTRMVQRRALLEGAGLAERLGDRGAATHYRDEAAKIGRALETHWDAGRSLVLPTLDPGGHEYKNSGLDVAVVLAVLHGEAEGASFSPIDDRVLASGARLAQRFRTDYSINREGPGIAIGRYPEDKYNGYDSLTQGHAWFLATFAYAEWLHRTADLWEAQGTIEITPRSQEFFHLFGGEAAEDLTAGTTLRARDGRFKKLLAALRRSGDDFIRRVQRHASPDGRMAEQFNRQTGEMQGAPDLTWSYASALTAFRRR